MGADTDAASMAVELRLFATFREAVGRKSLTRRYAEPVDVREVLADLETAYPTLQGALLDEAGDLQSAVCVVRNGRNLVHLDGTDTALADGDTLAIMPPVSGGSN